VPEGLPLEGVPAGAAPKPAWGKADQDNEPWEIRGAYSTTDRGQRHWQVVKRQVVKRRTSTALIEPS
jgi:hypothetical protein